MDLIICTLYKYSIFTDHLGAVIVVPIHVATGGRGLLSHRGKLKKYFFLYCLSLDVYRVYRY